MKTFLDFQLMSDDLTASLISNMERLRKLQNLTQSQVAKSIGIAQQTYDCYEKGIRKVPINLLPSISEVLNTTVADLLGVAEKNKTRGRTPILEQRFDAVRALPKKDQQFIIEMIDRVIGPEVKVS